MALYISHTLARLIKRRSYTSGEIRPLERRVKELRALLESAEAELAGVRNELAKIDEAIAKEEADLDPEAILVRRRTARRIECRHGTFIGEIVECLKAHPESIPIYELMDQVAPKVGFPITTSQERRYAQERIRRALNTLKSKGAVMRLPSQTGLKGQPVSRWLWIGL